MLLGCSLVSVLWRPVSGVPVDAVETFLMHLLFCFDTFVGPVMCKYLFYFLCQPYTSHFG